MFLSFFQKVDLKKTQHIGKKTKNDENKRKTESNEKVLDDSLTIVNNYYRFNNHLA